MIDVFALAFAAALFFSLNIVVAKRGMVEGGSSVLATIVIVSTSAVLFWVWLLARSTSPFATVSTADILIFVAGGALGTGLGRLSLYVGADHVGASVNNAVANTRPAFASVFAVFFLGELVRTPTVVGILLLTVGVVTVSLSRGGDITGWKKRELSYPLVAAVATGAGNVIRRFGLETTSITSIEAVVINESVAFVVILSFVFAQHGSQTRSFLTETREIYGIFVAAGVLEGLGVLSLFLALQRGPVTIVDPLSSTTAVLAVVLSYWLLPDVERITRMLVVGALLVFVGVVFITAI